MKVKANRTKQIRIKKEIEILSVSPKVHHDISAGGLWATLKIKCFVCRRGFEGGDSVTLGMYIEDGVQKSGGCHPQCVETGDVSNN